MGDTMIYGNSKRGISRHIGFQTETSNLILLKFANLIAYIIYVIHASLRSERSLDSVI